LVAVGGAIQPLENAMTLGSSVRWEIGVYAALKAVIVITFAVLVSVRGPARRPARKLVAFAACVVALGGAAVLRPPDIGASADWVTAGDVIAFAGGTWTLLAILTLGRCFGILPEARGLVTHGLYRLIRHPVYLGELTAAAGLLVAAPSLWNVCAGAAFASAQVVRIRLEERELGATFPEYADYAARTPRLVPRPRSVLAVASRGFRTVSHPATRIESS